MPISDSKLDSWVVAVIFWASILAAFFGGVTMVVVNKIEQGTIAVRCK